MHIWGYVLIFNTYIMSMSDDMPDEDLIKNIYSYITF